MADWQSKIDLTKVWESGDPKTIAAEIARQLRALDLSFLSKLSHVSVGDVDVIKQMAIELADEFGELAEEESPDVEDFDAIMEGLYEWGNRGVGNRKKLCWVATF